LSCIAPLVNVIVLQTFLYSPCRYALYCSLFLGSTEQISYQTS